MACTVRARAVAGETVRLRRASVARRAASSRHARGRCCALASQPRGLNVLLARPNRRTFADYNEELRCGSRVLLDRVLLAPRTLDRGWWRADALRQLVERHLAGRANDAPALGVILDVELFGRAFLDAQEQERFGLDELDQVQLRAADGWLVCTENTAPAPVAVHETPADTLMPGIPEQGPE